MKRISLLLAFTALMFGVESCIDLSGDEVQNPKYFSFATVVKTETQEHLFTTSFVSDADKPLIPTQTETIFTKLRDGQRVVLFFDIEEGSGSDNETAKIKIHQLDTTVTIAESARVSLDKEIDNYGTDRFDVTVSPYYPTMTPKYINLHVVFYGSDPEKHDFTVLYSLQNPVEGRKLKLTLAHDANKDNSGFSCYRWLSVPLEDYKEMFPLYNSLLLYVNTMLSGYQSMEFRLKDEE